MLDKFRETAITWDKANRKIYESLRVSAGDNKGRKLSVQLVNDGVIEDLSGASLSLFWETRDKAHKGLDVFTAVDATKGEFEIYYTTGMLSNEGTLNANLVLVDTSGRVVSEPFTITVFKGIDDEAVQSSDSFTALAEALITVNQYNSRITNVENTKVDKSTFEQNKLSVDQQLQHKVGGGKAATMADLGQDVKEAMTGGSVAVVGSGAVNNTNINPKQITPDKLTQVVTINRTDLPVHLDNQYVTSAGVFTPHTNWRVREYKLPDGLQRLDLSGTTTHSPVIRYEDGTFRSISSANRVGVVNTHRGTLLLNENKSTPAGEITAIIVTFSVRGNKDEKAFNVIGAETFFGNGYMSFGALTFALGYSAYRIPIQKNYRYKANLTALPSLQGSLFSKEGTHIRDITIDSEGYIDTTGADHFVVSVAPDDTVVAEPTLTADTVSATRVYAHTVNKPYVFEGKRAYLFGDSISEGYIGSGQMTTNTFFALFANRVGFASVSNSAKGGATFVSGVSATEDIPTTIRSKDLSTRDYIFIAGGTNDYGMGSSLSDFRAALESLCAYLKANVTAEVIFITPINRQKAADVFVAPLDEYRRILSEVVLANGYSLVNGKDFAFPEEYGTYQEAVMPDGLHPSELGYQVYANNLASVLC